MYQQKSQCKPPTKKELDWCAQLQKLLLKKPKTLWLYNTGQMFVMKNPPDGQQNGNGTRGEGVNSDNKIWTMPSSIESEGGDW